MSRKTFLFVLLLASCTPSVKPVAPPSEITKDIMSWLYYAQDNIFWSSDYTALDTASKPLTRKQFLTALVTGKYLPLRLTTKDTTYQLYPLTDPSNNDVRTTIEQDAQIELNSLEQEGKPLPGLHFTDLDGVTYDSVNTRGKIVVINCWYTHCASCVAEMPQLNQMVAALKNKRDIVFIGLAFDSATALRKFLQTNPFTYAIVPNQERYEEDVIKAQGYPTHIVLDRHGVIHKVLVGAKPAELQRLLESQ